MCNGSKRILSKESGALVAGRVVLIVNMKKVFNFKTKLWIYPSEKAAWHFLTIPKKESSIIKKSFGANSRGWGSLPVVVKIGKITWNTSIFPDRRSGTYILPVKAAIRKAVGLFAEDLVVYQLTIKSEKKR